MRRKDKSRKSSESPYGKQRERFLATEEELSVAEEVPNYEEIAKEYEFVEEEQIVVRRKNIALTPMNEEEAIQQMELLSHPFFMFKNAETGEVNVLYRREEGDYGVLVPASPA